MMYEKFLGLLHVSLHTITKVSENPELRITEELAEDIVMVLAKHKFIADSFRLTFTDSMKCEQKDWLQLALIQAGKRIETEKPLTDK